MDRVLIKKAGYIQDIAGSFCVPVAFNPYMHWLAGQRPEIFRTIKQRDIYTSWVRAVVGYVFIPRSFYLLSAHQVLQNLPVFYFSQPDKYPPRIWLCCKLLKYIGSIVQLFPVHFIGVLICAPGCKSIIICMRIVYGIEQVLYIVESNSRMLLLFLSISAKARQQ